MRGAREGGVGRLLVTLDMDEADIVGAIVPNQRRAGLGRLGGRSGRRQRLVIDLDQFGGVDRLVVIFRNDEGDIVADHPHAVFDQSRIARLIAGHAVAALKPAGHRQIAEAGRLVLGAGQNGEHAGRGFGFRWVDRTDARMGMRRAQHITEGHSGEHHVGDVAAVTFDQSRVFETWDGLANCEFTHQNSPSYCLAYSGVLHCHL